MSRLSALGRAIGGLNALALALWAVACADSKETTSGNGGASGTATTSGGASGAPVGGTTTTGGTVGTGGAPTGGGSGVSTGGASGSTAATGGSSTGGTPTGGGSGDAGSTATGGTPTGGAGGSPAGAGGTQPGGAAGIGGAAGWWFNGPRTPPATGSWPPPNIRLADVATGVTQPTAIAAPRGDTTRVYVTEKWGRIRLIKNGMLQATPALDMRAAVLEGGPQAGAELMNQGKRGLVGLAFHPNYEQNGRIFVQYVADQGEQGVYGTSANMYDDGDMTFAEYRRNATNPDIFDPMPVSVFLQFDKGNCNQCSQHNGGSLEVDVNGFLWASTGDPPPYDNPGSADLNNLNGKLLKFNISGTQVTAAGNYPGADPYVASIGIRNAYKFSVDRYTGDIYVGDVGENSWEEITVERYGMGNKDHEWPKKEGTHTYMATSCSGAACLPPVYDYGHTGMEGAPGADNCIVGGYVYRGSAIPALQGAYIYGDYGSGKVRAIQVVNGARTQGPHEFAGISIFLGCFGEDAAGELYACDYNNNKVVRVAAQ